MKRFGFLMITIFLLVGCGSDDSDNNIPILPTSFTGRVLIQETMEPAQNVLISFVPFMNRFPTDQPFEPIILFSEDGSFSADFEADEDIDFFTLSIAFFEGEEIIGGISSGFLLCDSFDACRLIPPGEAYQFDILITDESQIQFN